MIRVYNEEEVGADLEKLKKEIKSQLLSVDGNALNKDEDEMLDHLLNILSAVPDSDFPLKMLFEEDGDSTELRMLSEEAWRNGHYGYGIAHVDCNKEP